MAANENLTTPLLQVPVLQAGQNGKPSCLIQSPQAWTLTSWRAVVAGGLRELDNEGGAEGNEGTGSQDGS